MLMAKNNPQSVDRAYKFMYKLLGILFHQYFYHEGENIEFVETEIAKTGQRKDMAAKIDEKVIQITEFMSKALNDDKLRDLYDYHISTSIDPQYSDFSIQTDVISIANPNHGKNQVKIDKNITFSVEPIFTKNRNGWKVLSNVFDKIIKQEELSVEEAIDLLILPDMNIKMHIKSLMSIICVFIRFAKLPSKDFKRKIILCEIQILYRFFQDDELSEMIEMLRLEKDNPEIQRVIEKYGPGFDVIYFDGKADGITEGLDEGMNKGKLFVARNLLINGADEEYVSKNTGLPIKDIKELKKKI
jgi:hypothetical protein